MDYRHPCSHRYRTRSRLPERTPRKESRAEVTWQSAGNDPRTRPDSCRVQKRSEQGETSVLSDRPDSARERTNESVRQRARFVVRLVPPELATVAHHHQAA